MFFLRKNLHYFLKRYKINLIAKIFGFQSVCYTFEIILKWIFKSLSKNLF